MLNILLADGDSRKQPESENNNLLGGFSHGGLLSTIETWVN
jgi:hypothetical protein